MVTQDAETVLELAMPILEKVDEEAQPASTGYQFPGIYSQELIKKTNTHDIFNKNRSQQNCARNLELAALPYDASPNITAPRVCRWD